MQTNISKLYTTLMAKHNIRPFIKGAKRLGANGKVGQRTRWGGGGRGRGAGETTQGERESGRTNTGANGKVGETTRTTLV